MKVTPENSVPADSAEASTGSCHNLIDKKMTCSRVKNRKAGRVIELQGRVSLRRVVLVYAMKDSVRLGPIGLMIKKGGSFFVVHHFFGDEGVNVVKVAWFGN